MKLKCSLCGHEFDPEGNSACSACPIKSDCKVVCCPNCGYKFVDEESSTAAKFLKRLFKPKEDKEEVEIK